jgi:hypothetical protein
MLQLAQDYCEFDAVDVKKFYWLSNEVFNKFYFSKSSIAVENFCDLNCKKRHTPISTMKYTINLFVYRQVAYLDSIFQGLKRYQYVTATLIFFHFRWLRLCSR